MNGLSSTVFHLSPDSLMSPCGPIQIFSLSTSQDTYVYFNGRKLIKQTRWLASVFDNIYLLFYKWLVSKGHLYLLFWLSLTKILRLLLRFLPLPVILFTLHSVIWLTATSNSAFRFPLLGDASIMRSRYSWPSSSTNACSMLLQTSFPGGSPKWLSEFVLEAEDSILAWSRFPCTPKDLQTIMEVQVAGCWPCLPPKLGFLVIQVPPAQTTRQVCIYLLPLAINYPGFTFPDFLFGPSTQHSSGGLFKSRTIIRTPVSKCFSIAALRIKPCREDNNSLGLILPNIASMVSCLYLYAKRCDAVTQSVSRYTRE